MPYHVDRNQRSRLRRSRRPIPRHVSLACLPPSCSEAGTHEVQATVIGNEGGDLLTVLDELDSNTLSNSGVGLLGFDTDLI